MGNVLVPVAMVLRLFLIYLAGSSGRMYRGEVCGNRKPPDMAYREFARHTACPLGTVPKHCPVLRSFTGRAACGGAGTRPLPAFVSYALCVIVLQRREDGSRRWTRQLRPCNSSSRPGSVDFRTRCFLREEGVP